MRIRYDREADILMIILRDDPPVDSVEERGVITSYGENGAPVSVEFLHTSKKEIIKKGSLDVTLESIINPVL